MSNTIINLFMIKEVTFRLGARTLYIEIITNDDSCHDLTLFPGSDKAWDRFRDLATAASTASLHPTPPPEQPGYGNEAADINHYNPNDPDECTYD